MIYYDLSILKARKGTSGCSERRGRSSCSSETIRLVGTGAEGTFLMGRCLGEERRLRRGENFASKVSEGRYFGFREERGGRNMGKSDFIWRCLGIIIKGGALGEKGACQTTTEKEDSNGSQSLKQRREGTS